MVKGVSRTLLAFFLVFAWLAPVDDAAAARPVLTYGATDGYVWDLQHRLMQLGYYDGPYDGIFGWRTQKGVKTFQRDHGLPATGVVGTRTWNALYRRTFTAREVDLLTRLVYGEARGEPYRGQVAVAAVVLNRVASPQFSNTVSGVVFQPGAFSVVNDGQLWLTPNRTARNAVLDAIRGWDPSYGALFYYNPKKTTNAWIRSRPVTTVIGNHVFAK